MFPVFSSEALPFFPLLVDLSPDRLASFRNVARALRTAGLEVILLFALD